MDKYKPIKTRYRGFAFRSRNEARWATYFFAARIAFHYEGEGFILPGGVCYLPDFYIEQFGSWFEMKGVIDDDNISKAEAFARSGQPICVFPSCFSDSTSAGPKGVRIHADGSREDVEFAVCPSCKKVVLTTVGGTHCGVNVNPCHPDLELAFYEARSARFENGESPLQPPEEPKMKKQAKKHPNQKETKLGAMLAEEIKRDLVNRSPLGSTKPYGPDDLMEQWLQACEVHRILNQPDLCFEILRKLHKRKYPDRLMPSEDKLLSSLRSIREDFSGGTDEKGRSVCKPGRFYGIFPGYPNMELRHYYKGKDHGPPKELPWTGPYRSHHRLLDTGQAHSNGHVGGQVYAPVPVPNVMDLEEARRRRQEVQAQREAIRARLRLKEERLKQMKAQQDEQLQEELRLLHQEEQGLREELELDQELEALIRDTEMLG